MIISENVALTEMGLLLTCFVEMKTALNVLVRKVRYWMNCMLAVLVIV